MSLLVTALLYGVLLPGLVSAFLLLMLRPWAGSEDSQTRASVLSFALCAGYIAGHTGLVGWPQWSPLNIHEWLPQVALISLLGSSLDRSLPVRGWSRVLAIFGARFCLSILVAWLLLRPLLAHRWSPLEDALIVAAAGASLAIFWHALSEGSRSVPTRVASSLLLLITISVAVACVLAKTALVAQLAGAGASAMGALWLGSLVFPKGLPLRGAIAFVALFAWSAAALAFGYAALQAPVAVLLLALPLGFATIFKLLSPRKGAALASLALALAIGTASVAWPLLNDANSTSQSPSNDGQDEDPDYGYE